MNKHNQGQESLWLLGTRSTNTAWCNFSAIAAPVLEFPPGYITKEVSVNSLETGTSYNCVSKAYGSLKKKKKWTNNPNQINNNKKKIPQTITPILIGF